MQDKGISRIVLKEFYEQYKNSGVGKIKLHANKDIGGWAWARYGFCVSNKEEITDFITIQASPKNQKGMLDIVEMFYKDHDDKTPFPMNLIAKPEYKKNLMGASWWGEIDLTNAEQTKVFENYLYSK